MFESTRKDIKKIYLNLRDTGDFLDKFHQELRVYVKDNKPKKNIDYQKLTYHLNTLATLAKRKGWKTSIYLKKIAEIIAYTISGKQII